MSLEVVTSAEHPELQDTAAAAFRERWPEFIFHDELTTQYMSRVESKPNAFGFMAAAVAKEFDKQASSLH